MIEVDFSYTMSPGWQVDFAKKIEAVVVNDEIIALPQKIGQGLSFFASVIPGFSILLIDYFFKSDVLFKRYASSDDFYIFELDMIKIENHYNFPNLNNAESKIKNLKVFDSKKPSDSLYIMNNRIHMLNLFVEKKMIEEFLTKEEIQGNVLKCIEEKFYFNYMDSLNKSLYNEFREKSMLDAFYGSYFKGFALKILASYINSCEKPIDSKILNNDYKNILLSKEYLLNNLDKKFPSLHFLSNMAEMSLSKYKSLFKLIFNSTPLQFFIYEKFKLAQRLLQSGDFSSISEVIYYLEYAKVDHFYENYYKINKRNVFQDFKKKKDT